MPNPPSPPPSGPEFGLDDAGQFLEAFGRYLQEFPDSRARHAGHLMEAIGASASGTGAEWEAIAENQSLPEMVGGLAMAALVAGRVPGAFGLVEAFVVFGIANPFTAGLIIAGAVVLAAMVGGEIGENIPDIVSTLAGLLRDVLADPIVLDLDGDGIQLTTLASSTTLFDLDDDGAMERTGLGASSQGLSGAAISA